MTVSQSLCGNDYKRANIYFCNTKCMYLKLNKNKSNFDTQCCSMCTVRKGCEYKCNGKGNNNREMKL